MKKWTVRVEDDVAEAFTRFCTTNGISLQAAVTVAVEALARLSERQGAAPVAEWDITADSEPVAHDRFIKLVESARDIDARRRRRS